MALIGRVTGSVRALEAECAIIADAMNSRRSTDAEAGAVVRGVTSALGESSPVALRRGGRVSDLQLEARVGIWRMRQAIAGRRPDLQFVGTGDFTTPGPCALPCDLGLTAVIRPRIGSNSL